MIYGFHSRTDSKKEVIGKGRYTSHNDAVAGFAERKQLPIDRFIEMYEVIWLSNYL